MPGRRDFLKTAGLIAAAGSLAQASKPNLLLLVAGESRPPALPNLARLAQEGARFDRFYVADPAAGPSQASLVTGRFPFACGVTKDGDALPPDQPSIAAQLREAGYRTGFAGDWRLGPGRHGFENWLANGADADHFLKERSQKPVFLLATWEPTERNGWLLAALDDQRLAGETLVVFTALHGERLDVPFENAVRAPLILRYPRRFEPGRRYDFLASSVDVAPTLLALCGVPPTAGMQGRDLLGQPPESVYSVGQLGTQREWRMVVRGFDKLVLDRDQNVTHLYNLALDPSEMDNRAEDPSQELKRDELKALLKDWMRRTGDSMDPSGLKRRGPPVKRAGQPEPNR